MGILTLDSEDSFQLLSDGIVLRKANSFHENNLKRKGIYVFFASADRVRA